MRPNRRPLRQLGALAAGAWAVLAAAQAPAPVTLHYQERPPYSFTGPDGQVRGLLVGPLERAFQSLAWPYAWAKTPSQRQLALIQGGHGPDCGIGWFRNPEREALGRFSAPLYQDRPYMALMRTDTAWDRNRPLAQQVADAAMPLLVKDGYSYGPLLDGLIAHQAGALRRTAAESLQMARMVEAGRAAWMIVAPEEAEALLAEVGAGALQLQPLPGVPAGQTRHLYCNHAVSEVLLERLNRALAER